jgi:hypothetical protein
VLFGADNCKPEIRTRQSNIACELTQGTVAQGS